GAHFSAQPGTVPAATANLLAGDPTTVLVAAGNGLSRSTNGGRTWQQVPGVSGDVGFVGFESSSVGRAVSATGNTIWTTRDGGADWTATALG
ncbi:MAG TPA: LpqB family beta-propeller domain-containing protein, partial [Jatrophihabitans sp.]|nr:LpqB family beta-propeller domain-containing protein [Jatrophihabitans sp.]